MSSQLIQTNLDKGQRFAYLKNVADEQKKKFDKVDMIKSIKKVKDTTYLEAEI